jgi:hypothetical protein
MCFDFGMVVEAAAKMLGVGLPKQQKLRGGCLHILEYKANDTKQYVTLGIRVSPNFRVG